MAAPAPNIAASIRPLACRARRGTASRYVRATACRSSLRFTAAAPIDGVSVAFPAQYAAISRPRECRTAAARRRARSSLRQRCGPHIASRSRQCHSGGRERVSKCLGSHRSRPMAATTPGRLKLRLEGRWRRVGCHVARRLNIDGDRQGDLVRHGGEHRAALYTRSTHTGIGKPGSAEPISAMGVSPSTAARWRGVHQGSLLHRECRLWR